MRFEWSSSAIGMFALLALGFALPLGWSEGVLAACLVIMSVLLHELAHVLIVTSHGVKVKAVGLTLKGAYTRREQSPRWIVEAQSALAGPSANLLIWALFSTLPGRMCEVVALSNLMIGFFNLIPIKPLDGWRFVNAVTKKSF